MASSPPPAPTQSRSLTPTRQMNPPSPPLSEAEAKKMASAADLEAKIAAVESQIQEMKAEQEEIAGKLKSPNPHQTVTTHIRLLHDYNELRDIGTGLMGLIADQRGVRVKEVMAEFGVGKGD